MDRVLDNPAAPAEVAPPRERAQVAIGYAFFVLVGLSSGFNGVLLVAQMRDYAVVQTTIGLTFFTGAAGFMLASAMVGTLIHRYGTRTSLVAGGVLFIASALYTATRPPFVGLVLVQGSIGYAIGALESVLNVHLTGLRAATTRLNRLHAFFGVGALIGPPVAAWMLTFVRWPVVSLVLALVCVPMTAAVVLAYPRTVPPAPTTPAAAEHPRARLTAALRQRGVLLGAVMLSVYLGLEIGVGNWGYNYLVAARTVPAVIAGYAVSGYWLGLTLGRFLISPATVRLGMTTVGLMYLCFTGVAVTAALTWLLPTVGMVTVGFVLLGFFLGPIFPTTMAIAPRLTTAALVPAAIGVMNAGATVGGSALPWLAGALAHGVGPWTLLPFTAALALVQLAVWWRIARPGAAFATAGP